jgi:hypothetical protein
MFSLTLNKSAGKLGPRPFFFFFFFFFFFHLGIRPASVSSSPAVPLVRMIQPPRRPVAATKGQPGIGRVLI